MWVSGRYCHRKKAGLNYSSLLSWNRPLGILELRKNVIRLYSSFLAKGNLLFIFIWLLEFCGLCFLLHTLDFKLLKPNLLLFSLDIVRVYIHHLVYKLMQMSIQWLQLGYFQVFLFEHILIFLSKLRDIFLLLLFLFSFLFLFTLLMFLFLLKYLDNTLHSSVWIKSIW